MFDEHFNPSNIIASLVSVATTLRAVDLTDSPVSTLINQDAPSINIPSTQEQEHSLIISQGFEESPKKLHFHDDLLYESLYEDSTSQGSSSNVRPIHTLFESLGRCTKDYPIANVIRDPSCFVFMRKQLKIDAILCYFDAFLSSVEPKNFKQVMTKPSWIDAMQEEIHEFERLQVWELVPCRDKVKLIKLKWIYKVKTDEFGGVLNNKARLVAQGFRPEEGFNFKESFTPVARIEAIYTPMVEKNKLDEDLQGTPVNATLYRGMIGSLMYLTSTGLPRSKRSLRSRVQRLSLFHYLGVVLKSYGCIHIKQIMVFYSIRFLCTATTKVIALCCNNVQHSIAKQIDVRYLFIKEQVENGIVGLYFVRTKYQLADIFTKPLPRERFNLLIEKLGMRSMSMEMLKRLTGEENGAEPPKPKKIQKKPDSTISSEETSSKKKPSKAKKDVTSTKKPASKPKSTKKKASVKADRGKSGSGDGTDFESGFPDEQQRKISGTDERTGAKLKVPDVPKYYSKSDKESWGDSREEDDDDDDTKDDDDNDGNDDDDDNDGNDDDDSDHERTKSDTNENSNLNQSNIKDKEEEEYADKFTNKEDDADNAKDENEEELDDVEEL
nr:hypothetical protein [Tanacetum cinerariifolium]